LIAHGRGNVGHPVEVRARAEDADVRAVRNDPLANRPVVFRAHDVRPARDSIGVGGREPRTDDVLALAVHVDLRGVRSGLETGAKRVLYFVRDVATFLPLQLHADQHLALFRLPVSLKAGFAQVRGLEDFAKPVELRTFGEPDRNLRSPGEVDPELQALLNEDREHADRDQQPGGADREPLVPQEVDVCLAEQFHLGTLRWTGRRCAGGARTSARRSCVKRKPR
jgi:hypothetical protein